MSASSYKNGQRKTGSGSKKSSSRSKNGAKSNTKSRTGSKNTKSSAKKGGFTFDMQSLAALVIIILGVAAIIVFIKTTEKRDEENNTSPSFRTTTTAAARPTEPDEPDEPDETEETDAPDEPGDTEPETEPTQPAGRDDMADYEVDGTYSRTGVKKSQAATLNVYDYDGRIFRFTLVLPKETLSGEAVFTERNKACVDGSDLSFTFSDEKVKVIGGSAKGTYTAGEPEFIDIEETAATTQKVKYDASLKDSKTVRSTLKKLMSGGDYSLLNSALSKGSNKISSGSSEYVKDKNGKGLLIDSETGLNKYQYSLRDECEVILLCGEDGTVAAAVCDLSEVRYYASGSKLKKKIPSCIEDYFSLAYPGVEITNCN